MGVEQSKDYANQSNVLREQHQKQILEGLQREAETFENEFEKNLQEQAKMRQSKLEQLKAEIKRIKEQMRELDIELARQQGIPDFDESEWEDIGAEMQALHSTREHLTMKKNAEIVLSALNNLTVDGMKGDKPFREEQLYLYQENLIRISDGVIDHGKRRYLSENTPGQTGKGRKAAALYHLMMIEADIIDVQKKVALNILGVSDELSDNNRENKKRNRVSSFHENNWKNMMKEIIEEFKKISEILERDQSFESSKTKLTDNLISLAFLIISFGNSNRELLLSGNSELAPDKEFEVLYKLQIIDWIFMLLVSVEKLETLLPEHLKLYFQSCMHRFQDYFNVLGENEK